VAGCDRLAPQLLDIIEQLLARGLADNLAKDLAKYTDVAPHGIGYTAGRHVP
jgi:hypothetical protein